MHCSPKVVAESEGWSITVAEGCCGRQAEEGWSGMAYVRSLGAVGELPAMCRGQAAEQQWHMARREGVIAAC